MNEICHGEYCAGEKAQAVPLRAHFGFLYVS